MLIKAINWKATLFGTSDIVYKGRLFFLSINFPDNYPIDPPKVCFITPIYHVNVNATISVGESLGRVVFSNLEWWKLEYSIREILSQVYALFYIADPYTPYGLERLIEFLEERPIYSEKSKYFTKKYASLSNERQEYPSDKDWDFSVHK